MRKSPEESATIYKIGTKKKGRDDNYYYVLIDKNNRKRWIKENSIFVIYKINPNAIKKYWSYRKFPGDWKWIGGGTTIIIQRLNDNTIKYPNEEQFIGNPKYTPKMRKVLSSFFKNLKEKNIIKNYKLVTENELQNYMKKINY